MIFEGRVEKQEVSSGSIGAPSGVLSMTERSEHRVVTMRLVRVYRGDAEVRVTVLTGLGTGDCGFDFENGRTYLVYAERLKANVLSTSICMATASVEESGAALRHLRGESPLPEDFVDSATRHREFLKKTTGSVCGRVIMPDGKPLRDAVVELLRVREEPLPAETLGRHSDTDNSKEDGSFCVKGTSPGKYLLDALDNDLPDNTRWVGYYAGTTKRSEAILIQLKGGGKISDLRLPVQKQGLYTVKVQVVGPETTFAWKNLGISLDSPGDDLLSFHQSKTLDSNGASRWTYVPAGHYRVSAFVRYGSGNDISNWRMANQEIEVGRDTEIELKLANVK